MPPVKNTFAPVARPTKESRDATPPGPELSVIVPTRNEHDNVLPVYDALCRTLQGIDWEAIFVDDDSHDGTTEVIYRLASQDRRVRCVQRIEERADHRCRDRQSLRRAREHWHLEPTPRVAKQPRHSHGPLDNACSDYRPYERLFYAQA